MHGTVFFDILGTKNMATYQIQINGEKKSVDAEADMPLLWVIRDLLGLKGTKYGCGIAQCGACTLHIDGIPMRSCQIPISGLSRKAQVTTIEGIGETLLHPVQEAWIEEQVPQCGYCQSGQIMSAVALLKDNPNPTDEEIKAAMNGHLCRCGTYDRIGKGIKRAAMAIKSGSSPIRSSK
jgi:isoquinoline 1-oxidoreductase alpha subunit